MIYLKSALFGVGGALLAVIIWIFVSFALPIFMQYVEFRLQRNAGVGAIGGGVDSGSILIAAVIGFIVAFAYRVRLP